MKKYDTILLRIANTLLVNAQHLPVLGLLDGQLGVALFFYQYARYSGKAFYSDYADKIMDAVVESIQVDTPKDFGSGLAGIGWAVDWLMKNEFVEADEEAFEDIDTAIGNMSAEELIAELDADIPLFSKGIYALARNRKVMVSECILQCETLLKKEELRLPLEFLRSICYFLDKAFKEGIETSRCEKLLKKIAPPSESDIDQETMIRACWIETIYDSSFSGKIEINDIEQFIDRSMQDIEEKNLTLYGGLAGLGLSLIRLSQKQSVVPIAQVKKNDR